jgi:lysyl-tRNA synthetase class 2
LASIDPTATDRGHLAETLRAAGMRVAEDDTWADLFSRVIVEKVEPQSRLRPRTILYEYPVAEAALARPSPHDPRVAERFEVYACGVELANAFGELTDARGTAPPFRDRDGGEERVYGETYPIDEDFLKRFEIMPQASGIALGFDRLVMLATGASRIDQVLWAPVAEYGR